MHSPEVQAPRRPLPSWLFPALGYLVAGASLVWVFHGVDLLRVIEDFSRLEWHWILVAVIADVSVYVVHGWRWSILLTPLRKVPVGRSIRAVYVGIFANEVLPLRTGEVIRCYLQGRWNNLPFSTVLSSLVIERVFDGIWLAVAFYLTTLFLPLPGFLLQMGRILAVVVVLAVVVLLYFKYHKHHARSAISNRKWLSWLHHLIDGLHEMGHGRTFYLAFLVSLPYLVLQMVPFYALMANFELGLSVWAAFVVLIVVRLGTAVPQAPGNVGTFQFMVVVSLALFAVDKTTAASLSLIMFGVITLPLLVVGFIALAITGVRINELRKHAESTAQDAPSAPADPALRNESGI